MRALALPESDRHGKMTDRIQSSKDRNGDYSTEASDE